MIRGRTHTPPAIDGGEDVSFNDPGTTLTLQLVLGPPALQQREVTHDVLQLHRARGRGQSRRRPHGGRAAFDQLQPCRENGDGGRKKKKVKAASANKTALTAIR
ncbi:hypothetical protein EYF80_040185 [Liparis tanakae]|uniref:Uncharacterized protein n=1 Tax=Liparis tanakae TaxID=230148 RepID=A0A4Z2G7S8_9TELE|nr:hypothetical protein EYF80_040185 [Liparis tanakae]